jgi:hypothetical protein
MSMDEDFIAQMSEALYAALPDAFRGRGGFEYGAIMDKVTQWVTTAHDIGWTFVPTKDEM